MVRDGLLCRNRTREISWKRPDGVWGIQEREKGSSYLKKGLKTLAKAGGSFEGHGHLEGTLHLKKMPENEEEGRLSYAEIDSVMQSLVTVLCSLCRNYQFCLILFLLPLNYWSWLTQQLFCKCSASFPYLHFLCSHPLAKTTGCTEESLGNGELKTKQNKKNTLIIFGPPP